MFPEDIAEMIQQYFSLITYQEEEKLKISHLFCLSLLGPRCDYRNQLPIHFCAHVGYAEYVQFYLTQPKVDPRTVHNYSIGMASYKGHLGVVNMLLNRVDPSDDDNWAIRSAAKHGHVEVVRLLL